MKGPGRPGTFRFRIVKLFILIFGSACLWFHCLCRQSIPPMPDLHSTLGQLGHDTFARSGWNLVGWAPPPASHLVWEGHGPRALAMTRECALFLRESPRQRRSWLRRREQRGRCITWRITRGIAARFVFLAAFESPVVVIAHAVVARAERTVLSKQLEALAFCPSLPHSDEPITNRLNGDLLFDGAFQFFPFQKFLELQTAADVHGIVR